MHADSARWAVLIALTSINLFIIGWFGTTWALEAAPAVALVSLAACVHSLRWREPGATTFVIAATVLALLTLGAFVLIFLSIGGLA